MFLALQLWLACAAIEDRRAWPGILKMRAFDLGNWIQAKQCVAALSVLFLGAWFVCGQDYKRVEFEELTATEYVPEAPEEKYQTVVRSERDYLVKHVAVQVLELDGERVEIPGYMLPISVEGGKVSEFLLMPDTGACCFGVMPSYNSWVLARTEEGVTHFDDIPVRIRGSLKVEEVWHAGFFSHLYYMDLDELAVGLGKTGVPAVEAYVE